MNVKIELEPTTRGSRGQRYRVLYQGEVLCGSTRNPEFDACRALLAHGVTGTLEVWHRGAAFPSMRVDIERGAQFMVAENEHHGPRLVKWQPAPSYPATNGPSRSPVEPPAAIS